jgi:hypothetical protein
MKIFPLFIWQKRASSLGIFLLNTTMSLKIEKARDSDVRAWFYSVMQASSEHH